MMFEAIVTGVETNTVVGHELDMTSDSSWLTDVPTAEQCSAASIQY